jgi:amidase
MTVQDESSPLSITTLLEIDAAGLQKMMQNNELTSVQLVKAVLAQIQAEDRHGARLNAMISVAPEEDLIAQAEQLDSERRGGKTRGPLHGIPIIVKVRETRPIPLF